MTVQKSSQQGHGFGTAPVFLAAISTILGAILFLRFGYAVAHTGLAGSILIILIGHIITIPTAMAIAEIATNLKVEGGGEYFIISRSFGSMVGGTIGVSLYFSQAISVAFYMIAFAEAFTPAFGWVSEQTGLSPQTWMVSLPATIILLMVIFRKGASLGVGALWYVVAILGISLLLFFLGRPQLADNYTVDAFASIPGADNFFVVFAIIFPAFTGMTAGVGLSGDLKNPRRSIPLGTLSATVVGMIIYLLVVVKLRFSLSPDQLAADQLAMSSISLWGPIIPIGLAAATLSSAIGSILIAPRTLQALASDDTFPNAKVNRILQQGRGESNEPANATLVTSVIVLCFVSLGSVDFVAQIISMFFMITYGTLCLVSFLEHFAGNPSYRPTFRSKWYLSLVGAVACFVMMFQMAPAYASLAVVAMASIYLSLKRGRDQGDLSSMLKGALFQLTRSLQILLQRHQVHSVPENWRPSFIAISSSSISRLAPFDLLRWISDYYGFGSFIHFVKGNLTETTNQESKVKLEQMIRLGAQSQAAIYVDTIVSPSFRTAVAQVVQIPGISGMENNSILFEFPEDEPQLVEDIIDGCHFASVVGLNICILRSSERHFGYKRKIHVWLTQGDYRNAGLMIMLAYIIMGHQEWNDSEIELLIAVSTDASLKQLTQLNTLIDRGRIPISRKNLRKVRWEKEKISFEEIVTRHSEDADLVIMGFSVQKLSEEKGAFVKGFPEIKDILFVRAGQHVAITDSSE